MLIRLIIIVCVFAAVTGAAHGQQQGDQHFQGFDLAGYDQAGNKSWDIEGDTANIVGDNIKLTNINANAYGDEDMNLTARHGTLDKASGNMYLRNDVVITTQSGVKLVTDSLDWDRGRDLVQTDDPVTLTRENMIAVGKGAQAQPNLKTAQMNTDVDVKVSVETEGEQRLVITITCDGPLEVDYQKELAVFNNNVVAIDGDRKLMADRMELYFDVATSEIKEIVCVGNVMISRGESTSYSDTAVYKAAEQRVVLSGRPKIVFYTQEGQP